MLKHLLQRHTATYTVFGKENRKNNSYRADLPGFSIVDTYALHSQRSNETFRLKECYLRKGIGYWPCVLFGKVHSALVW